MAQGLCLRTSHLKNTSCFIRHKGGYFLSYRCETDICGGEYMSRLTDAEVLLTPAEVAALFRVDPKTVTRWAKAGKLTSIRTLGGHRRYRESEVKELLQNRPKAAN